MGILENQGFLFFVLQKKAANRAFGPVGPFRQITAHFFEQKDVQINRFGHIEHFRKKLPMILG